MRDCPCGTHKPYEQCCGQFLDGMVNANTAQALMRSRYTAYTRKNEEYLLKTWHPSTRPHPEQLGLNETVSWTGLQVVSVEEGGEKENRGIVEFIAQYVSGNRTHTLHERSRFTRHEGVWVYVDGETPVVQSKIPAKIGRNDQCYCGSGKKFKKCCL